MIALRYFLPSGEKRLQARQKKEVDAITVLQDQVASLKSELHGVKLELRRLSLNEDGNREYRHALANRANLFLGNLEVVHGLLLEIVAETPELAPHFVRRIQKLKAPTSLLRDNPLPTIKQWTIEEIERMENGESVT